MNDEYKVCTRCVMDMTDPKITFDDQGVCTHCRRYDALVKRSNDSGVYTEENLQIIVNKIKERGVGKKHDCVIGLSGGVDSSYLAYMTHKLGLRPLCVHLDNGWDSELAVKNIERIVRKFKLDLYTYVLDWEEFKDLQLSFLKAGVVDLEIPTDQAIFAIIDKITFDNEISYLLFGGNITYETTMPFSWNYTKNDVLNLMDIHHKFGTKELKVYPIMDSYREWKYSQKIKKISPLDYIDYNIKEVMHLLKEQLGWKDYGMKHGESVYTRFYQGYILPVRFNIDKRKAHLCDMINAGQMSREEALEIIRKPIYQSDEQLQQDKEYVLKKLGLSDDAFKELMNLPKRSHFDYFCGKPPRK